MCRVNYLLASRPLPPVESDPDLPSLTVTELPPGSPTAEALRRVAPAAFVYAVSPARLCGCYLAYEDRSSFEDASSDAAAAAASLARYGEDRHGWVARESRDAVHSLGRYVARHAAGADLALYVCWENEEGAGLEERDTVTPEFFGGPHFGPLREYTLLIIRG